MRVCRTETAEVTLVEEIAPVTAEVCLISEPPVDPPGDIGEIGGFSAEDTARLLLLG